MIPEMQGDIFQWLRGFYYVASTGTVSQAAKKMRRSQSTVTQQIKNLEHALNKELFDRTQGQMQLTLAGKKVFDHATQIFALVSSMQQATNPEIQQYTGNIVLAAPNTIVGHYLPAFIHEFIALHPTVTFNMIESRIKDITMMVNESRIDFGFSVENYITQQLQFQYLFKTEYVLILPQDHPYTISPVPSMAELAAIPTIGCNDADNLFRQVSELFSRNGLRSSSPIQLTSAEPIKNFVKAGIGGGVIDRLILHNEPDCFKVYPLNHFIAPCAFGIISRKSRVISSQATAFMNFLLENPSLPMA